MGRRGPKPRFNDVACPNENCDLYEVAGKGNMIGNGTYNMKSNKGQCNEFRRVPALPFAGRVHQELKGLYTFS